MSDQEKDWVEVGRVMRPHGIRGELRVKLHNPDSEVLFDVTEIVLRAADETERVMSLRSVRPAADGIVLLAFDAIESRTDAEALRSCTIHVSRDSLPTPQQDEFYVHDILGAQVVDEEGKRLGEVVDYLTYPSADVLVVKGEKRYEVPVIDDFVRRIDPADRLITVAAIDDFETT